MRILHLLASPFWSGPAEVVAQLAQAQRALGHEVSVAVDRLRGAATSEEPSVPRLREAGLLADVGLELSTKSSPVAMLRDRGRLAGLGLDVVHTHFTHDHLLARWGRPRGAVLVRSIHAPRSVRWSLPHADAYTVPYAALATRLGGQRVEVLPACAGPAFRPPADRAALQRALGLEGSPVLGMVSTFQPSRRHAIALEGFAKVVAREPGARLVLVGDGLLEPELRVRVAELGLGVNVTFAGYQPGPAFVRWLQALDEVWILGLGNDWAGRAAAQARACGVRVVAVDEGALADNADAVVAPEPAAIAREAAGSGRRAIAVAQPETVAERILKLYDAASASAR